MHNKKKRFDGQASCTEIRCKFLSVINSLASTEQNRLLIIIKICQCSHVLGDRNSLLYRNNRKKSHHRGMQVFLKNLAQLKPLLFTKQQQERRSVT